MEDSKRFAAESGAKEGNRLKHWETTQSGLV
jgi:hypothetical protein